MAIVAPTKKKTEAEVQDAVVKIFDSLSRKVGDLMDKDLGRLKLDDNGRVIRSINNTAIMSGIQDRVQKIVRAHLALYDEYLTDGVVNEILKADMAVLVAMNQGRVAE